MKGEILVQEVQELWGGGYKAIQDKEFKLYHPNRFKNWLAGRIKIFLSFMGILFDSKEPVQIVRTHRIWADNLLELIQEYDFSIQSLFDQDLKYCVMGPEIFAELSKEGISATPFFFKTSFDLRRDYLTESGRYTQAIVWGISVAVLPWVKGLVMLPELSKPAKEEITDICFRDREDGYLQDPMKCYGKRRY